MNFSEDESIRPPKNQKANTKAKTVAAGAGVTSLNLFKNQHELLDQVLEYLKTSQEGLDTCEAHIKDIGTFWTSDSLKDAQHHVNTMQAHCDFASNAIKVHLRATYQCLHPFLQERVQQSYGLITID